jgi:hypothetical protein
VSDLVQIFEERLQEIEAYLELLDAFEKQVQEGPPRVGETGPIITVQQQRILYSSVYLQLYNLVEATVTYCIEAVTRAIAENGSLQPGDLSDKLRREWVRFVARTHVDLNPEKRLESALSLCEHLVQSLPIKEFRVEKGVGGSWDDLAIQDVTERMGLPLKVSSEVFSSVKRPFKNDQGPLAFIKNLRNNLAHGSLSFAECGEGITVGELRDLKDRTANYLREVTKSFQTSIDSHEFLLPTRRPGNSEASSVQEK